MTDELIARLAAANPFPHDGPLRLAEPIRGFSWRLVLGAAVGVAALAGAGIAIAAGFGAFSGISAAQRPQTPADRINPALLAEINSANSARGSDGQLLADSSRLVRRLPGGTGIYAVSTADGQLCVLGTGLAGSNTGMGGASAMGCGSPLTQTQPTTMGSFKANGGTPTVNWGIALDHINALSFHLADDDLTVPVKDNVWAYQGPSPRNAQSVVVHYDDGTSTTLTP
jgi:hypothetical protein